MTTYKNELAFIPGGSEGIGLAAAKLLISRGCKVAIFSRNPDKLKTAGQELDSLATGKDQYRTYALDITKLNQVHEVLRQAISDMGTPSILMNCAGVAHPGYLPDIDVAKIDHMVNLNLSGPIYVCKTILPFMLRQNRGHIINVSSVAGYLGLFGYTAYCASKFGIVGFSEALKSELANTNICVSVLCPPNTRTPGLAEENKSKPAEVLSMEEKVKVLEPMEVAEYVLKKLPSKSFWIIPTMDSRMAHWLKRLSPSLISQFTKRPSL